MPSPDEDEVEPIHGVGDQPDSGTPEGTSPSDDAEEARSLLEDLEYLIADARIWIDAEMSFQKSRAALVANRIKIVIAAFAVAALLAVLALIGLTVGLIIALTPLITAWGATAVVVVLLLLVAWFLVKRAALAIREIQAATRTDAAPEETEE